MRDGRSPITGKSLASETSACAGGVEMSLDTARTSACATGSLQEVSESKPTWRLLLYRAGFLHYYSHPAPTNPPIWLQLFQADEAAAQRFP